MIILKPYHAYQDTGVMWLGTIPEHWETRVVKRVISEVSEKGYPELPLLAATQSMGVVRKDRYGQRTVVATSNLESLKRVCVDDFVISLRSFQGGIERAYDEGIISSAYTVLRHDPVHLDTGYLARLFKSRAFITELELNVTGIREGQNINFGAFRESRLPTPPLDEQRAIADFLDAMDARITRFIAARKKMIRLLEEKKQAVINQAVTKGLDPTVPMKDSGVEWLGEIPAHWELRPNRFLFRQHKELVGNRADEFTLLSLTLRGVIVRDMENPEGKFPAEFSTYQAVEPGDMVFCLFDIDETPRCVGLSMFTGMITGAYTVLRPIDPANAEYLYRYYLALDQRKALKPAYTGLRKVISRSRFMAIKSPVPPPEEQWAINKLLDDETSKIDSVVARAQREMELIQEYRTRLISDVVTGKLDVRGVDLGELPEFEEVPEPEETSEVLETAGVEEETNVG